MSWIKSLMQGCMHWLSERFINMIVRNELHGSLPSSQWIFIPGQHGSCQCYHTYCSMRIVCTSSAGHFNTNIAIYTMHLPCIHITFGVGGGGRRLFATHRGCVLPTVNFYSPKHYVHHDCVDSTGLGSASIYVIRLFWKYATIKWVSFSLVTCPT